jgi:hypothetical protein
MEDQREVGSLARGVMLPLRGAIPIRTITAQPSLSPTSSAASPLGSPYGRLSPLPEGGEEDWPVYHVPHARRWTG